MRRNSLRKPTIRASELSQFAYCRRAWWLSSVQGQPPTNLDELRGGTRHHRKHGRGVSMALNAGRIGRMLVLLGLLALVAFLVSSFWGG